MHCGFTPKTQTPAAYSFTSKYRRLRWPSRQHGRGAVLREENPLSSGAAGVLAQRKVDPREAVDRIGECGA